MAEAAKNLIPDGFILKDYAHSQTDSQGGFPGVYVLILCPENEAHDLSPEKNHRELLVLMRENDNRYRLVDRSTKALAPYGWDSHFPDSFSELSVTQNQLRIIQYGGGRKRWGREDFFRYDQPRDSWYWQRTQIDYSDTQNLASEGEQGIFTPQQFGEIPLSEFDLTAPQFTP